MSKKIGIFIPNNHINVNAIDVDGSFEIIEFVEYRSVFELWELAYKFFIDKDSSWAFAFSNDGDVKCNGNSYISLTSFGDLYKETIPCIFENEMLYDDFVSTFFNAPVNDCDMLYLNCDDLIGVILSVRNELSLLLKYDTERYGGILNAIAMGRVLALRELSQKVQLNEKSDISVVHAG
jgi:hypothetical protein